MVDAIPSVLSEILSGDALGMGAAAKLFPAHRGEGRARPSTIWRWITHGARTANGAAVKLEAARVGGRWLTSRAALTRFATALTPPSSESNTTTTPPTRTEKARQRSSEAAVRRLTAAGA